MSQCQSSEETLTYQGLLWFVNYKKGLFILNQQNTAAPTQAEMSGLSVVLGEAFNKCLLRRTESAGSSSTSPYFIRATPERGVTLRPDLPKTPGCIVQSKRFSWNRLSEKDLSGESRRLALLLGCWEAEAEIPHSPELCSIRPEATRSDHILGRKPIPCVRNHLLWLQHPF